MQTCEALTCRYIEADRPPCLARHRCCNTMMMVQQQQTRYESYPVVYTAPGMLLRQGRQVQEGQSKLLTPLATRLRERSANGRSTYSLATHAVRAELFLSSMPQHRHHGRAAVCASLYTLRERSLSTIAVRVRKKKNYKISNTTSLFSNVATLSWSWGRPRLLHSRPLWICGGERSHVRILTLAGLNQR